MKVCFVGTGSIGKRHIKNWARICEEHSVNLETFALRSAKRPLDPDISSYVNGEFHSIDEMGNDFDVIFITNPTHMHYETMLKLKDKARAFFVEKPVFDTWDIDVDNMKLPEDNIYYVACPLRYTKVLQRAGEILKQEHPCSVRAISSSYLPNWRAGIDYRKTYSAHKAQGGGVKIDLIHEWDYLVSLFGFPREVTCLYGKYSDLEIDSEDLAVYIAEYENLLLELHLDYFGRVTRRSVEVRTDKHEYIFDIAGSKILLDGIEAESFEEDSNEKYLNELRYFWEIIFQGANNTNRIEQALEILKMTQ